MGLDGLRIIFDTCNSSDTSQQWEIAKPGYASDSKNICLQTEACLTDLDPKINKYKYLIPTLQTNKPDKEARYLKINLYKQSDTSQNWLMPSTTPQLSNVKYPKACITTRHHLNDPASSLSLECIGNDYNSPNPKLSKHLTFHAMPALDKNGEQLCIV